MKLLDKFRAGRRLRRIQVAIDRNDPVALERRLLSLAAAAPERDAIDFPASILLDACGQGRRADCVRLLIDHGWRSHLNAADARGHGCLHRAIDCGDADTVRVLLAAGADPKLRDRDGVTPLNLCKSYHGLSDIARLLLEAGGNPNLVDKHGKNYLM